MPDPPPRRPRPAPGPGTAGRRASTTRWSSRSPRACRAKRPTDDDVKALVAYLGTLDFPRNPYREPDGSLDPGRQAGRGRLPLGQGRVQHLPRRPRAHRRQDPRRRPRRARRRLPGLQPPVAPRRLRQGPLPPRRPLEDPPRRPDRPPQPRRRHRPRRADRAGAGRPDRLPQEPLNAASPRRTRRAAAEDAVTERGRSASQKPPVSARRRGLQAAASSTRPRFPPLPGSTRPERTATSLRPAARVAHSTGTFASWTTTLTA